MNNIDQIPILKHGGIHIKPENRGKFTEYCGGKVSEECIRRGKNSPNPLTRKRAAFAGASRTWKHKNGGQIMSDKLIKRLEFTPIDKYQTGGKSQTVSIRTKDGGKKTIKLPSNAEYNKYDNTYRIIEERENGLDTLILGSPATDGSRLIVKSPSSQYSDSPLFDEYNPKYTASRFSDWWNAINKHHDWKPQKPNASTEADKAKADDRSLREEFEKTHKHKIGVKWGFGENTRPHYFESSGARLISLPGFIESLFGDYNSEGFRNWIKRWAWTKSAPEYQDIPERKKPSGVIYGTEYEYIPDRDVTRIINNNDTSFVRGYLFGDERIIDPIEWSNVPSTQREWEWYNKEADSLKTNRLKLSEKKNTKPPHSVKIAGGEMMLPSNTEWVSSEKIGRIIKENKTTPNDTTLVIPANANGYGLFKSPGSPYNFAPYQQMSRSAWDYYNNLIDWYHNKTNSYEE